MGPFKVGDSLWAWKNLAAGAMPTSLLKSIPAEGGFWSRVKGEGCEGSFGREMRPKCPLLHSQEA